MTQASFVPSLARLFLVVAASALCAGGAAHAQERQTFGAWTVECQGADDCISYYAIPGLQIVVGKGADAPDTLFAEVRVLSTSAAGQPVSIQVDDGWTGAMEVVGCNAEYCSFALDLSRNQELLEQFRAHSIARVAYVAAGAIVMLPVDLSGFARAVDLVGQS